MNHTHIILLHSILPSKLVQYLILAASPGQLMNQALTSKYRGLLCNTGLNSNGISEKPLQLADDVPTLKHKTISDSGVIKTPGRLHL